MGSVVDPAPPGAWDPCDPGPSPSGPTRLGPMVSPVVDDVGGITLGATGEDRAPSPDQRRIVALVLSHNAPVALARCLVAIAAQTTPPDAILVVDNASTPPVSADDLPGDLPPLRIVRSDVNTGPAGGWARAFQEFLEGGDGLAWVMDDDAIPEPECLAALNAEAQSLGERTLLFPLWVQPDGSIPRWGAWCGFLIAREVIEAVGLPREELFWWAEDTEYTHIRLPRAGYERRQVAAAVVHHRPARHSDAVPTWKYYYEARNMTYLHLHIRRKLGRYPRNIVQLIGRAIIRDPEGKGRKLAAIGRGLFDGVWGRLGVRFPVEPMQESSASRGRVT